MAARCFSHVRFMTNTHWLQAFQTYGIYQTGIFSCSVLFVIMLLIHALAVWRESCRLSGMQGCITDALVQQLVCALSVMKPQEDRRVWVGPSCVLGDGVVFSVF